MVVYMEEEFVTPQDIAKQLDVEPETVMQWLRTRRLLGYKVGKLWRVSKTDYAKFLRESYNSETDEKQK